MPWHLHKQHRSVRTQGDHKAVAGCPPAGHLHPQLVVCIASPRRTVIYTDEVVAPATQNHNRGCDDAGGVRSSAGSAYTVQRYVVHMLRCKWVVPRPFAYLRSWGDLVQRLQLRQAGRWNLLQRCRSEQERQQVRHPNQGWCSQHERPPTSPAQCEPQPVLRPRRGNLWRVDEQVVT